MPISYRVSKISEGEGDEICTFGQLVFSGAYKTSGDSVSPDYVTPPFQAFGSAPFPLYRKTSIIHGSRPPISWSVDLQGLYIPCFIVGVAAFDFKVLIFDVVAGTELAATNYPAQLTQNPFSTMELSYRKNL